MDQIIHPDKIIVTMKATASAAMNLKYGTDFEQDQTTTTVSQTKAGSETRLIQQTKIKRRGNVFQYFLQSTEPSGGWEVDSVTIAGKTGGQKKLRSS